MSELILKGLLFVAAINFIASTIVPTGLKIWNYVFRDNTNVYCYQRLKYSKSFDDVECWESLCLDFVVLLVVAVLVGLLHSDEVSMLRDIAVFGLLFFLSLPILRWMVDVARNLKVKRDSGESVRLKEMEDRIKELENR